MNRSIGLILLNLAVALYLIATGILGLTGRRVFPDGEIRRGVTALFRGDLAEVIIVVLSILAIAAGAFILLKFFGIGVPMTELILIILAISWVVFIVMIDIVHPLNNRGSTNFVDWLRIFGSHLMVLGGICLATERFGG
jgi:fatty acid desaturase